MNKELKVILSAVDNASNVIKGVENSLKNAGETVSNVNHKLSVFNTSLVDFSNKMVFYGSVITGAFSFIGKGVLESAMKFEQYGIAFETMLGDAEKSKKLLEDIAVFATKTPFNLEDIVEGSKRLAAYGIEAEKLIPTMEMLGNITAGIGKEKMPQLILAYGQVRAATKLTGAELRQFTEAGVPLLEALVNKANEAGGTLTMIGGLSKSESRKINSLNAAIVDAEISLDFFKKTGKGTEKQIEALKDKIDRNKYALKEYGKDAEVSYIKVKESAASMIEKISDGQVKFEDVHEALLAMTTEGGKYFNLMAKQSKTLGGVLANLQDAWQILSMELIGVNVKGEIAEGSLFDIIRNAAVLLLDWINANKPAIVEFFNSIGRATMGVFNSQEFQIFLGILRQLGEWVIANGEMLIQWVKGLAIALVSLTVIGQIASLITFLLSPIGLLMLAITALYVAWENNFMGIRDIAKQVMDWLIPAFYRFMDWVAWLWGEITKIYETHKEEIWATLNAVMNIIKFIIYVIVKIWENWGDNLINLIRGIWEIIVGIFRYITAPIVGAINTITALLKGDWEGAMKSMEQTATTMRDAVIQIFKGFVMLIINALDAQWGHMTSWFKDRLGDFEKWADDIRKKISEAFKFTKRNSPSIKDELTNTQKKVNEEIHKIVAPEPLARSPYFQNMSNNLPQSKVVNINFNGQMSVRSDSDIKSIANEVKRIINREDVLFAQGLY